MPEFSENFLGDDGSPDEPFVPESELKKVKEYPREKRREKLSEFKKKLAEYKKEIASIEDILTSLVTLNPELEKEKLYEWVEFLSRYSPLPQAVKKTFFEAIEKYHQKHSVIKEIHKQFPDNEAFFQHLCGFKPQGKIEVVEGPINIHFRCYDIRDFTYLLIGGPSSAKNLSSAELSKKVELSKEIRGIRLAYCQIPEFSGLITAENASYINDPYRSKIIFQHEQRHVFNNLFTREIQEIKKNTDSFKDIANKVEKGELSDELVLGEEQSARHFFRIIRNKIYEEKYKDEILAYLTNKDITLDEIADLILKKEGEGGMYDFFKQVRKFAYYSLQHLEANEDKRNLVEVAIRAWHKVMEEEHQRIIKDALNAYKILLESGYSQSQAINLLSNESLPKWGKVAARLITNK